MSYRNVNGVAVVASREISLNEEFEMAIGAVI
jgi:hypothetical protein